MYSDASTIYRDSHSVKVVFADVPFRTLLSNHGRTPAHIPHRPHPPLRRPRRRPGPALGRHARGQRAAHRRSRRRRHRRTRRRHRARARQAARPDARRGDEDRPGALDRRLHRDPGVRARGVQADARVPARRRPAAPVQGDREAAQGRARQMPAEPGFAEFEHEAFAAASIGQVHRATTNEGEEVAVKIQYPGIAEAVETDLRNMQMLFPLVKRLAPGPGRQGARGELRERIARRARLRGRGPEPPRDGARAGAAIRSCTSRRWTRSSAAAACSSPSSWPAAASSEVKRARRRGARPLRRDRLPLLLRHAQATCAAPPATRTPATTCYSRTAASASSTSA